RHALQGESPGRTGCDRPARVDGGRRGGGRVRRAGGAGAAEEALRDRVVDGGGDRVGDRGPREEEQALLVRVQTGGAEGHDDDEDPEGDPRANRTVVRLDGSGEPRPGRRARDGRRGRPGEAGARERRDGAGRGGREPDGGEPAA